MQLHDTTTVDIAATLNSLRVQAGSVTLGRVLTLLVIVPHAQAAEEAITTARATSRAHPCRVVVIIETSATEEDRLDAELRIGESEGASEVVILHPHGGIRDSLDSLVMPLLLPDTPVVVWWPFGAPTSPAEHPLGHMAQRRITDTRACADPISALDALGLNYRPGDTDLAWAGITLWRALAVTLVEERPRAQVERVTVRGNRAHPSTHLMAGWLGLLLEVPVALDHVETATLRDVVMHRSDGDLAIRRADGENVAWLCHPARVDQPVNLPRRSLADCLTEDLRRLNPDAMYARVITRGLALLKD
ncbi:MAG: glucose-6-phosphate dehydrogenase assembly protein OpcA [Bowdeniella nasicola]|nr:glucose-6-phosphate dehydrogenase assembly protein OpcA [Bowdeniella nasicola]